MSISQYMLCCVVATILTIGAKMVTGSILNSTRRDVVRLRERLLILQTQLNGAAKHHRVVGNTLSFYETRKREVLELIELQRRDLEELVTALDGPEPKPEKEIKVHSRGNDVVRGLA